MTERFTGPDAHRAILEVLLEHRLVHNDRDLALDLSRLGSVLTFQSGQDIVTQDKPDSDVYFLLSGEAAVLVNNRAIATRGHRDAIGEASAIDPAIPRSATVRSRGVTVALKVGATDFQQLLDKHPKLWKPIAKCIAERLRERRQFHRPPNATPVVFVGSSVEGLAIARELPSQFKHDPFDIRLWTSGVFGPSGIAVDSLLEQVACADFAVFVFGPDDSVGSRDATQAAPRDNVIFEMGLFMGRIGRPRVFMLMEHGSALKIPSDLLGVIPLTFVRHAGVLLESALVAPCQELRKRITAAGVL